MKLNPIPTRRALLAVLSAIAVCAALPVGAAEGKLEVSKVSYGGSSWLGHYPVWVGIKKGIFEKKGLTVTWQPFGSSSARMSALMAGELDFAGTGSISALALMASGATAFYLVGTPDSYATVEGIIAGPAIKTVQDLKGKKLGV